MTRSIGGALLFSVAFAAAAGQSAAPATSDSKSSVQSGPDSSHHVLRPRVLKVRQAKPPAHDSDDVPPVLALTNIVPAQPIFPDPPLPILVQDYSTQAPSEKVYRVVGGTVKAPYVIYRPDPKYPEKAHREQKEGTVVLWMVVGANGLPRNIKVARSLSPELDQAAIDAVKKWKFDPATKDGKPVAVQIYVEVTFRLK